MTTKSVAIGTYVSIPAAFEEAVGKRISRMQAWRFSSRGVGGIVLKTIVVGCQRRTTVENVLEWIAAVTTAKDARRLGAATSSVSAAGAATSSDFLDKEGI